MDIFEELDKESECSEKKQQRHFVCDHIKVPNSHCDVVVCCAAVLGPCVAAGWKPGRLRCDASFSMLAAPLRQQELSKSSKEESDDRPMILAVLTTLYWALLSTAEQIQDISTGSRTQADEELLCLL